MLSFMCKTVSIDQVLRCGFGLSKTELELLKKLLRSSTRKSADELSTLCDKDLTTVQRSLKSLASKNLVKRFQLNYTHGGYVYTYEAISRSELKKRVLENLSSFETMVQQRIDAL